MWKRWYTVTLAAAALFLPFLASCVVENKKGPENGGLVGRAGRFRERGFLHGRVRRRERRCRRGTGEGAHGSHRALAGSGTLNVTVRWPKGALVEPSVSAILNTTAGNVAGAPAFTLSGDAASMVGLTLEAGYHMLEIHLRESGNERWAKIDTVRIAAESSFTWEYSLTQSDREP